MTNWVPTPLAAILLFSACSASQVPRHFSVPENAQNPIVLRYQGTTVSDMTTIIAEVCSDVPIPTAQVVPERGFVETRWVDVAGFNLAVQAETYPLEEREVIYVFQAQQAGENAGVLQIGGWYQPTAPSGVRTRDTRYDRFVPTGHPGYQLMLQFEYRLKQKFAARGITVTDEAGQ